MGKHQNWESFSAFRANVQTINLALKKISFDAMNYQIPKNENRLRSYTFKMNTFYQRFWKQHVSHSGGDSAVTMSAEPFPPIFGAIKDRALQQ